MKEDNHIFWRDEILQLLFWMRGEGMGESQSSQALARFLNLEESALMPHLILMMDAGYLVPENDRFALSAMGQIEGSRRFREEFEPLLSQGHGECNDPNCDCHELGAEYCKTHAHEHPASPKNR